MRFSMNGRKPTELESCVLGLIKRTQPCTGYSVRKVFQQSLTASWNASTGAIYPLLRKLLAEGLIREEAVGDSRGTRRLSITAEGDTALREWLMDARPSLGTAPADPIRTRSYVLSILDRQSQLNLVSEWREATTQMLAAVHKALANADQPENRLAFRGAELQLEARLQWLDELTAEL